MRDYPPARTLHEADCPEAPPGLLTMPANAFADSVDFPHSCISPDTIRFNRPVVAEPGDYDKHLYVESTLQPTDAPRKLCRECHGTHPEDFNKIVVQ